MRPPPPLRPTLLILLVLGASAHASLASTLPYAERFDGGDGGPWPAPWFAGGAHVTVADLQGNRGRLDGDPMFVSRMILPGFSEMDVEVNATVEFEDVAHQGFGFYVRQNGGTLQEYAPHGQGYAIFLKGNWAWPEDLGIWREIDGVETQFAQGYNPVAGGLQSGVRYHLRYRLAQTTPAVTTLQAKVWPESAAEPTAWTIETTDSRAELQGTAGSFAIDIYNHTGTAHLFVDDLVIRGYPALVSAPHAPALTPALSLSAPRPHPIRGGARIDLALPERSHATLRVYDTGGRLLATPFAGALPAGAHTLAWDATDHDGAALPPGVYFLRLSTAAGSVARRIVVGH